MILITVVLLASIAAIIFALIYKAKSDTRKQIQRFEEQLAEVASQYQISWSAQLISKHRAFAWHAGKRLLFFMDFPDEGGRRHVVDMSQVTQCKLIERMTLTPAEKGMSADKNITSVALELCFDSKECIALPMYTEVEDGTFERGRLTDQARHWQALIQAKG
jgi:hypothetical protein